jgi:Cu/Ag efflux protein CusF
VRFRLRGERELRVIACALALCWSAVSVAAQKDGRFPMRGMVMKVAPSHRSFVVSHDNVPGAMDAMMMSFDVQSPKDLDGVGPGMTVTFTLVMVPGGVYAEHVRV